MAPAEASHSTSTPVEAGVPAPAPDGTLASLMAALTAYAWWYALDRDPGAVASLGGTATP